MPSNARSSTTSEASPTTLSAPELGWFAAAVRGDRKLQNGSQCHLLRDKLARLLGPSLPQKVSQGEEDKSGIATQNGGRNLLGATAKSPLHSLLHLFCSVEVTEIRASRGQGQAALRFSSLRRKKVLRRAKAVENWYRSRTADTKE